MRGSEMATRKKSRLESFLSLNQHRKRLGATKIEKELKTVNLNSLKTKFIDLEETSYTHGADKCLTQHLENLQAEFTGQAELLYYHAKLIVLIRRNHKPEIQFQKFKELWSAEGTFLLKELNTRWLVSAADTFADHSEDALEKAIALSISVLVNTIKISETERYLKNYEAVSNDPERTEVLKHQRIALFDGTSAFAIGTDDTLRNMRWRMDEVCKQSPILGSLLEEIFRRLQEHDTIYSRFKQLHTRPKTAWW